VEEEEVVAEVGKGKVLVDLANAFVHNVVLGFLMLEVLHV
jgi:hypothetical protein